ncbi:MAG: alpha/beta fold hydrolase [Chloroflexi bacterium]|nr:alpha/beta fold hydrolase [Chloroflexota bacterium]MBI3733135.1 alpha/beta fold hydrolase [Chloroflexota bacterium]
MPTVSLNGEQIYYAERGNGGLPVVLVHGAGGSHQGWLAPLGALAGCTCYALDLPAHGQSSGKGRDSIPAYADVVAGFLDALGLSSAVIAGHSLGGGVALWLALRQPERVRGLILAGTGARLRVHPNILQAAKEGRPISTALVGGAGAPPPTASAPPRARPGGGLWRLVGVRHVRRDGARARDRLPDAGHRRRERQHDPAEVCRFHGRPDQRLASGHDCRRRPQPDARKARRGRRGDASVHQRLPANVVSHFLSSHRDMLPSQRFRFVGVGLFI